MFVVLQTGAGVVRVADLSSAARGLDSGSAAVPGCCVGGHWHHYPVTPHCNTGTPGHKLILVTSTVMNMLYSEKAFSSTAIPLLKVPIYICFHTFGI